MAKIKLVLELDPQNVYDAQVVKILSSVTEAERKNLLVSSLLYWSRSPAFQLNDKLDSLLTLLSQGGQVPVGQVFVTPAQAPTQLYQAPRPAHAPRLAPSAPPPSQEAVPTPIEQAKDSFDDGADDAFGNLFAESVSPA